MSTPHFINQQVALQVVKSPGPTEVLRTLAGPALRGVLCLWAVLHQFSFYLHTARLNRKEFHSSIFHSTRKNNYNLQKAPTETISQKQWERGVLDFLLGRNNDIPFFLPKTCGSSAKPLLRLSNDKNILCTDDSNFRMGS